MAEGALPVAIPPLARHRRARRRRPISGRREQRLRQRGVAPVRARAAVAAGDRPQRLARTGRRAGGLLPRRRRARTWASRSARTHVGLGHLAALRVWRRAEPRLALHVHARRAASDRPAKRRARDVGRERRRSTSRRPRRRRARSTTTAEPRPRIQPASRRPHRHSLRGRQSWRCARRRAGARAGAARASDRSASQGGRGPVPVPVRRAGGPGPIGPGQGLRVALERRRRGGGRWRAPPGAAADSDGRAPVGTGR